MSRLDAALEVADAVDSMPADAQCCICMRSKADNVILCDKGHNACRECATRMLQVAPDSRCPLGCAKLVRPGNQWISNIPLNNLVLHIKVPCPNKGCDCACKATELSAHLERCEHATVPCKIRCCPWEGKRKDLHDHLETTDHSRYLVDMLLFVQASAATTYEGVEKLRVAQESLASEVGGLATTTAGLRRSVELLGTNVQHGSERSQRRDKKTAKDVAALTAQLKSAIEAKDNMRADYVRHEEECREAWVQRLMRAEEEATRRAEAVHLEANAGLKRRIETLEAEVVVAHKQVHDMHHAMKQRMPHAVPRCCPCEECAPN